MSQLPTHRKPTLDQPSQVELEAYLTRHSVLPPSCSIERVVKFSHGQSNPTYLVELTSREPSARRPNPLVLRKKPPPPILPSAHAIEREYRAMAALHSVGFPVPRPIHICESPSVLGTPFYIMQYVQGRIHESPALEDVPEPKDRRRIYLEMARLLARLHSIDPSSVGLGDFGKRGGEYVARQVETWNKQFERSRSSPVIRRAMHELYGKLRQYAPRLEILNFSSGSGSGNGGLGPRRSGSAERGNNDNFGDRESTGRQVTIAHGDFRLDNIIFDENNERVLGLLDWELSTLGDPMADVAYSCLPYYIPRDRLPALALPRPLPAGVPSLEEYLQTYCAARRIQPPETSDWNFYVALGLFRLASILAGVAARAKAGNASSTNASELASEANVLSLAHIALDLMGGEATQSCGHVRQGGDGMGYGGILEQVRAFVHELVLPAEEVLNAHARSARRWEIPPLHEELKTKAKARGLWNLWISPELASMIKPELEMELRSADPQAILGRGLSNAEYARAAEIMGYSRWASEVFNCSAPDTGNMEVLLRYGTLDQQRRYLLPLLRGETRSCFAMTEPRVASSDATNIESSIVFDEVTRTYVLNGSKWWISGACDPRCRVAIFMGKTRFDGPVHKQQSMILVPMPNKQIKNIRPLTVFGYDDAPEGHAELTFDNVRVPEDHMILGPGRGFEIAQGRLGPGRIHHCMRLVGMGQRALDLLLERIQERSTFGKRFIDQPSILEDVARCRIDLNAARLVVLDAAEAIDTVGAKTARGKISIAKVYAPNAILAIIDRVIQIYGGAGVSDKVPLAAMYASVRTLRLADGPDFAHLRTIAKEEIRSKL